ncbi:FAD-binding oxidoreductase [Gordonia sp. NB41Y]|uniref:FAD-binding oxidoreductase n=1 Tax=Gordonia sp. NB41Y TaxID=875808 RepID=UPI001364DD15|nr:FAD-binding oxidoreductase [Gordonia sp. NB41Y]WLP90796.1 FAD-binding oxidoreductase [Gordonia sp. NB41Y]
MTTNEISTPADSPTQSASADGVATTTSLPPFGELAVMLTGTLVLPGDPGWPAASSAWNLAVPQRPAAVVVAESAADVVTAVRFALRHHIRVSAQPGGHGATTALDDTILIRTRGLADIWIDADNAIARVGAGVKWVELQSALDGTGLTGPMGSSGDVSVTGFCLGGGLSMFGRTTGVGAHAVRAAEVVDGLGRHRWIDDSTDPELMWALRGGGGDFAIVTAVELSLTAAPEISGGRLVFPATDAPTVWRAYAEITGTAPDELTLFASMLHFPPIPELPEEIRGQSLCAVDAVYLGSVDALDALLVPIRAAGIVVRDTVRPLAPGEVGTVCEEPDDPSPAYLGTTTLGRFDDDVIDTILARAATPACGVLQVQIRHLGGALLTPSENAVCRRITAAYSVMAMTMVPVPEAMPAAHASVAAILADVEEFYGGPLSVSMLGDNDPLAAAFSPEVIARLRVAKNAADPDGVFRSSRPVI